ncbi:MAG: phosphotransferase family protein, partial [Deltaproteobacteria bacterium]|nr:phosphotransferase family protein [Deltaproteobacteria bacterium]
MSRPQSAMVAPLQKALQSGAPHLGLERVISVERFTSGLSSQSYSISAETDDGPATWVMRLEPEHGVIPPYDITREYRLMAEVGAAGILAPKTLYLEEDASAIGGRFMLMAHVDGVVYGSRDPRLAEDPELLATVQDQFIETLARIHETPQTVLPAFADGPTSARAEVEVCRRRLEKIERIPAPILRHTLDVLDRMAPESQRIGLLHGDYRLPNLMWKDGKLVGVLDWELARVGDPLSDLAFTQTVGIGPCAVEGELAQRYSERTGVEIDEKLIVYYKLLELAKSSIIGL